VNQGEPVEDAGAVHASPPVAKRRRPLLLAWVLGLGLAFLGILVVALAGSLGKIPSVEPPDPKSWAARPNPPIAQQQEPSPVSNPNDHEITCDDISSVLLEIPRDPYPDLSPCGADIHELSQPPPSYPKPLLAMGVQGKVKMKAYLEGSGKVDSVFVLTSPHPLFSESAQQAVLCWTYSPPRSTLPSQVCCFKEVDIEYVIRD